ncbi:LTA synthase family protein [Bifidobacterium sp. 64T4]|uniref:LTA synthase family protein n=1 Tax=Bifidobacterium pongonis TaxID=2834432 RepID=UPI001C5A46A4|nr:LTA synthase family protein [Bifidobacterium pongonis]MBW3094308.1 LTA synthase family protein [Bifidobacterium pongonis]
MSDDVQVTSAEADSEVTQASSDSKSVQNDNSYDTDKQRSFSQDSQIGEGHRGETDETSESRLDEPGTGEPDDDVESTEEISDTDNSSDEQSVKSATNAKPTEAEVKHPVRTTISAVRDVWRTFTNLKAIRFTIDFFRNPNSPWHKRPRCPYTLYALVFVILTVFEVIFIQWGMYSETTYAEGQEVDETTKILGSVAGQTTQFVAQMWLEHKNLFLLNCLILGAIYLTLILVLNRFWIATAIFGTVMTTYAVANNIKVQTRNEPLLPSDLNFITGGNTGELTSFIPTSSQPLVHQAIAGVIWLVVVCIVLQILDRRNCFIYCSWRHPFASAKNIIGTLTRIAAACASVAVVVSFTWGFGNAGYWSTNFAEKLGDEPQMWNGLADSTNNGPAVNFVRLAHTKIMDKPEGYSREAMEKIATKYSKQAKNINQTRSANMTDNTVIMILSETFSDPTRVPGVSFSEDPMPNIRQLKTWTTSGLMLSPGYGGGTANIEYQALTGLSMANYSSALSIAYQQLVPSLKWTPSLNQAWNAANGEDASVALHAYNRNMYFRDINYKKFAFSKFYATNGVPQLKDLQQIDSAWYASDESFYKNVLEQVSSSDKNKFYQVVTMQNHMPYEDLYTNNQFKDADTSQNLSDTEHQNIETYTKGLNYTDQSTLDFLNKLNEMDRPITVIFYGDHLPGIYSTAYSDSNNVLGLHETDYFIWSNNASKSAGTKLDDASSAYTSSNYFSAQLASHLDAKVSPYLAFLTEMHQAIPALSVPSSAGGNSEDPVYLDANGNRVSKKDLPKTAKAMLHEYQLIQYDMSAGKNYLKSTGFVDFPK